MAIDVEKAYMDHMIEVNMQAGRTFKEAQEVCEGFKKNFPDAWKEAMDEWFDEIHQH